LNATDLDFVRRRDEREEKRERERNITAHQERVREMDRRRVEVFAPVLPPNVVDITPFLPARQRTSPIVVRGPWGGAA
jgi:hypothetical protein